MFSVNECVLCKCFVFCQLVGSSRDFNINFCSSGYLFCIFQVVFLQQELYSARRNNLQQVPVKKELQAAYYKLETERKMQWGIDGQPTWNRPRLFRPYVHDREFFPLIPFPVVRPLPPADECYLAQAIQDIIGNSGFPMYPNAQTVKRHNITQTQTNGIPSPPQPCILCKTNNHPLYNCPELLEMSHKDRFLYVKTNKLCFGCLMPGHSPRKCYQRHNCDLCKGRHHTCLHDDNYRKDKGRFADTPREEATNNKKHEQKQISPRPCTLCKGDNHPLRNCEEFIKWSVEDRHMYAMIHKLCYKCLKPGHGVKKCYHPHSCYLCGGRHHTCLHFDKPPQKCDD